MPPIRKNKRRVRKVASAKKQQQSSDSATNKAGAAANASNKYRKKISLDKIQEYWSRDWYRFVVDKQAARKPDEWSASMLKELSWLARSTPDLAEQVAGMLKRDMRVRMEDMRLPRDSERAQLTTVNVKRVRAKIDGLGMYQGRGQGVVESNTQRNKLRTLQGFDEGAGEVGAEGMQQGDMEGERERYSEGIGEGAVGGAVEGDVVEYEDEEEEVEGEEDEDIYGREYGEEDDEGDEDGYGEDDGEEYGDEYEEEYGGEYGGKEDDGYGGGMAYGGGMW
ncbi:Hypothetical protein D9617_20g028760 [Elsinoe fawcettii]|nr:Hypothetical protein D9617_20g028760 [Elsinoe fawcettii]